MFGKFRVQEIAEIYIMKLITILSDFKLDVVESSALPIFQKL